MKKDDSFWNETMDNLDEKYIRETAEKLAEHEENIKQYAPVLLKIPEKKKNEHKAIYGIAAGLALVGGLALTAVIIASTRGIDIKPSQTSNTLPPATETKTSTDNMYIAESTTITKQTAVVTTTVTDATDTPKTTYIIDDPAITITADNTEDNDASKTTVTMGTPVETTTATETIKEEADYLPEALFTRELDKDLSLFEEQFYGRWINCEDRSEEKVLYLTYGKDCFGPVDNYWHYLEGFYSGESGDYMVGMKGGLRECFYIPTDEPDRLYHYTDVGGPIEKKNYSFCYEREAPADAYDSSIMASTGKISYLGYLRIKQLTDFELPRETTKITLDGTDWITASSITRECGNLYANSIIQENRLVLTQQYVRMDTIGNADSEPELQYFTLYFEKKDDKWKFTKAERYMSGLETEKYGSDAYRIVSERVDEINSTLDEKTDEACTIEQEIDYFTDSDGFYYAIRRIYPSMAKEEEYDEVYWFNGTNYERLICEENYETFVLGKILDAALRNNYLYVYSLYTNSQNDRTDRVMIYKSNRSQDLYLIQSGGYFDCRFIGDYMIIENEDINVFDISKECTPIFEAKEIRISKDGKSFTAIKENGETFSSISS